MSEITITRRDCKILQCIYNRGKITATQMADEIKMSQPVISRNIQKFYDADIVNYEVRKSNRSMKWFYLTDDGKTFLALLKRIFEEI